MKKLNHLKLFEEYRLFKGDEHTWRPKLGEPNEKSPYYYSSWDSDNQFDPNEPFFNRAKNRYKNQKSEEFKKQADQLNEPIKKDMLNKMGINDDILGKLRMFSPTGDLQPSYVKDDDYYYLAIWGEYESEYPTVPKFTCYNKIEFLTLISTIKYFVPENDYIVTTIDYSGGHLKKKFDNIEDGINWLIAVKNNKDVTKRNKLREI